MNQRKSHIRIGSGAGFSGDRLEPAVLLAEHGNLDYLVLECLAERTIALAQQRKMADPEKGYDPFLERRLSLLFPFLRDSGLRVITNMGAANPVAAAKRIAALAAEHGLSCTVAAVSGDDVLSQMHSDITCLETGAPITDSGALISANAYLGTDAILPALQSGAQIIITGRVADPSLFLAPLIHEFGWDTPDLLAAGTVIGHLLECGAQVCGGYFMDTKRKFVPDPANPGFPIAEVGSNGTAEISKLANTGGRIDSHTVREQLLYEVLDPFGYITPDVVADFSTVRIKETGRDRMRIEGATGKPRTDSYKTSVGYHAFWLGEGEISYAGTDSRDRAELAAEIIRERLSGQVDDINIELIGGGAIHRITDGASYETRLRVAGKAKSMDYARLIGEEVEALYTNGPAGGGGARKFLKEVIGIHSVLLDRTKVQPQLTVFST